MGYIKINFELSILLKEIVHTESIAIMLRKINI